MEMRQPAVILHVDEDGKCEIDFFAIRHGEVAQRMGKIIRKFMDGEFKDALDQSSQAIEQRGKIRSLDDRIKDLERLISKLHPKKEVKCECGTVYLYTPGNKWHNIKCMKCFEFTDQVLCADGVFTLKLLGDCYDS